MQQQLECVESVKEGYSERRPNGACGGGVDRSARHPPAARSTNQGASLPCLTVRSPSPAHSRYIPALRRHHEAPPTIGQRP